MLAMVVNDGAGFLKARGVLEFIASMLAPTRASALGFQPTICRFVQPCTDTLC